MESTPVLLTHDRLLVRQTVSIATPAFDVLTPDETLLGAVETTSSDAKILTLGARDFEIRCGDEVLALLKDPLSAMLDDYTLYWPDGRMLAAIDQEWKLFGTRMAIDVEGGERLRIDGAPMSFDFDVLRDERVVARVRRDMPSVGTWIMRLDEYSVDFEPDVPPVYRLAILGTIVAIDRLLAKRNARS